MPPKSGPGGSTPNPANAGPGLGGRRGGRGPGYGGTHLFPSGFHTGVPVRSWFMYPSVTTTVTQRRFIMPFGLQGKGLLVGLLLGFFAIPWIIRAMR